MKGTSKMFGNKGKEEKRTVARVGCGDKCVCSAECEILDWKRMPG